MEVYGYSFLMIFPIVLILLVGLVLYMALTPSEVQAQIKAEPTFNAYNSVMALAPLGCPATPSYRLCDYYMASSAYSLFPGAKIYDYISDNVIPMLVKAGPRVVELDIYDDGSGGPVVGLKNQKLGIDYAYNTVPFGACCVAISNNAFNSVACPVSSDPFVLSLVFHTTNNNVMNACAEALKTSCHQYLLGPTFGYQRKNLAIEPICNLQSKLIVISGGEVKGTLMEELVNLSWGTSNLRRLTYTQAAQTNDSAELIKHNRDNITMVVPDVGSDLVNMNSQILLTYGCQWNLMNYGSVDSAMEVYIGEFQEHSVVLKPEPLRAIVPEKYKTPVMPDPSISFQPMRKTSPIYDIKV
uniref:phosphoinositide phospholipase C n=1 Tax=viral metagenome TaxID=1070528 RepID=A0A6C0CGK9_9ZZZZ